MLVWLQRAISDRDAQLDFIAQDNPLAAVSQGDRIDEQVDFLLQQPQMGRPGRRQGTRELVISRTPFILVYRPQGPTHRAAAPAAWRAEMTLSR